MRFLAHHPIKSLLLPWEGRRPLYLLALASGGALLVLLALRARRSAWPLIPAAPLLAVQLYDDRWEVFSTRFQYGSPVVPLFAAAAILALSEVKERRPRWVLPLASVWLLATFVHSAIDVGPKIYGGSRPIDPDFPSSARAQALRRAIALVPDEASVSAQPDLVPHVAERERIHQWPDGEDDDRFVLLDGGGMWISQAYRARVREGILRLRNDPRFLARFDQAGVALFEHTGYASATGAAKQ
jgi:hypothetical protein